MTTLVKVIGKLVSWSYQQPLSNDKFIKRKPFRSNFGKK